MDTGSNVVEPEDEIRHDVRLSVAIGRWDCTTARETIAETVDTLEADRHVEHEDNVLSRPLEYIFDEHAHTTTERVAEVLRELHDVLEEFDIVSWDELRKKLDFADSFLRNL